MLMGSHQVLESHKINEETADHKTLFLNFFKDLNSLIMAKSTNPG